MQDGLWQPKDLTPTTISISQKPRFCLIISIPESLNSSAQFSSHVLTKLHCVQKTHTNGMAPNKNITDNA